MNTLGNSRYRFIEEIIEESVFSLLKRRKYDDFSIKEICHEANINRSTFYAHFADINDLLLKIESKMSKKIELIFKPTDDVYDFQVFVTMFDFIKENRFFYKAFLKGNYGVSVESEMIKKIRPYFRAVITRKGLNYSDNEALYHMLFFTGGLKLICARWLEHNCLETSQEMAKVIVDEYLNNANYF
ncbi:MAG: TetR/AcrR family transcriptional regulator [Bacillales bacterium]|jgi:AcrR family transcriptional regulator|nr:TetR/AcrR family transcriptional regulator [Bacillales bacterium]